MNILKTEWAKLKQMNFTEKRQYIWEYYKIHLAVLAVVLFVLWNFLNIWVINPPKQEYLYFAWMGPFVMPHQLDNFTEALSVIVDNTDRYEIRATNFAIGAHDPQLFMAMQTRFIAALQVGSLDIFLLLNEELQYYTDAGFLLPLDGLMQEVYASNPGLYNALKERLVEVTFYANGTGTPQYMAIDMQGVAFFEEIGVFTGNLYLAIVSNTRRFDRALRALEVIFDE